MVCGVQDQWTTGIVVWCGVQDQWTTGIVVISRHKEANRRFKRALEERAGLVKWYLALTAEPVPLGR